MVTAKNVYMFTFMLTSTFTQMSSTLESNTFIASIDVFVDFPVGANEIGTNKQRLIVWVHRKCNMSYLRGGITNVGEDILQIIGQHLCIYFDLI